MGLPRPVCLMRFLMLLAVVACDAQPDPIPGQVWDLDGVGPCQITSVDAPRRVGPNRYVEYLCGEVEYEVELSMFKAQARPWADHTNGCGMER